MGKEVLLSISPLLARSEVGCTRSADVPVALAYTPPQTHTYTVGSSVMEIGKMRTRAARRSVAAVSE